MFFNRLLKFIGKLNIIAAEQFNFRKISSNIHAVMTAKKVRRFEKHKNSLFYGFPKTRLILSSILFLWKSLKAMAFVAYATT